MRYTIMGFNQAKALELNLDVVDLSILRWLADYSTTGKMKNIYDNGKIFFWVSYDKILKDMPILDIKKDTLYRKMKKMCDSKILSHKTIQNGGTFSFYGFGDLYINLIDNSYEINKESSSIPDYENIQNNTSDSNPYPLGFKSVPPRIKIRNKDNLLNNLLNNKDNNIYNDSSENLSTGYDLGENEETENKQKKEDYLKSPYCNNVYLSDTEYAKLSNKFGRSQVNIIIQELSKYKSKNNKSYADDYKTLLNWARKQGMKPFEDSDETPYEKIRELCKEYAPDMTQPVKHMSIKRKTLIKNVYEVLAEKDLNWFIDFFKKIQESDFLCGRIENGMNANLDWVMDEDNIVKILEGKFKNRKKYEKKEKENYGREEESRYAETNRQIMAEVERETRRTGRVPDEVWIMGGLFIVPDEIADQYRHLETI